MKKLVLFLTLMSSVTFAQPEYLKDGVITVTLKDGKTYTYSTNEYMVVKRGATTSPAPESTITSVSTAGATKEPSANILSVELVNGQKGQSVTNSSSEVTVETKRKMGVGLQYQRNVNNYYLGVRVDTLGNLGGLLGVGF